MVSPAVPWFLSNHVNDIHLRQVSLDKTIEAIGQGPTVLEKVVGIRKHVPSSCKELVQEPLICLVIGRNQSCKLHELAEKRVGRLQDHKTGIEQGWGVYLWGCRQGGILEKVVDVSQNEHVGIKVHDLVEIGESEDMQFRIDMTKMLLVMCVRVGDRMHIDQPHPNSCDELTTTLGDLLSCKADERIGRVGELERVVHNQHSFAESIVGENCHVSVSVTRRIRYRILPALLSLSILILRNFGLSNLYLVSLPNKDFVGTRSNLDVRLYPHGYPCHPDLSPPQRHMYPSCLLKNHLLLHWERVHLHVQASNLFPCGDIVPESVARLKKELGTIAHDASLKHVSVYQPLGRVRICQGIVWE
mmetsp:Transcript_31069/g.99686  ORF Transcript_31069/g.99686 Transcript_31069/m.99686 type:complete len:359 (-) Transcript_31069:482-1558(-)